MTSTALDVPLRTLDPCFEGGVPATLCTCSTDGVPNLNFLSVVHRVDDSHVALSFQYFRKTKKNLSENPRARLLVIEPTTGAEFLLSLELVRTETEGEIFDRLAVSLSAIASQTGMQDHFKLRGADIYRVLSCERRDNGVTAAMPVPSIDRLSELSRCSAALATCSDLDELLHCTLTELETRLGYEHAFVMAADEATDTLFSIASRGYSPSGVGAELKVGEGLAGIAAQRRLPVRVANMSRERILADAVRAHDGCESDSTREIAMPGLKRTESQLVVPLIVQDQLLGVLCLQSEVPNAFGRVDEELVTVVAHQLASGMARFDEATVPEAEDVAPTRESESPEPSLAVRHYAEDDSVFLDNEYLIKGVAGRVLWLLLLAHEEEGRVHFTNRELRLDPRLGLPPIKDNLETRLLTLRKRLEERSPHLRIRKTGRGRFELQVGAKVKLESV